MIGRVHLGMSLALSKGDSLCEAEVWALGVDSADDRVPLLNELVDLPTRSKTSLSRSQAARRVVWLARRRCGVREQRAVDNEGSLVNRYAVSPLLVQRILRLRAQRLHKSKIKNKARRLEKKNRLNDKSNKHGERD